MARLTGRVRLAVVMCCLLFASTSVHAGTLDDFERDTTAQGKSGKSSHDDAGCYDCTEERSLWQEMFVDPFIDGFMNSLIQKTVMEPIATGMKTTRDRTSTYQRNKATLPREKGDPLLPFVRLDLNYQSATSDVTAKDIRVEGGKSLFGFYTRMTRYEEREPNDRLDLLHLHAMLRLSYGNQFTFQPGIGVSSLKGEKTHSNLSIFFPFFWHFHPHIGMEYRAVFMSFNNTPSLDHDFNMMFHHGSYSINLGYRILSNPESSLGGYYAGFSYRM